MYFTEGNWQKSIAGNKTQTRRLDYDGEYPIYCEAAPFQIVAVRGRHGRLKWEVGRKYALGTSRGRPPLYWTQGRKGRWQAVEVDEIWNDCAKTEKFLSDGKVHPHTWMANNGFAPVHFVLLAIRHQRLQDITEEDAKAEGCNSVLGYSWLWDSINKKPYDWAANPKVWSLTYRVLRPEEERMNDGAP